MPPKTSSKSSNKTPRPPKPVEEQLKRHFNSLCAQVDGGHFKNAIKTCEKILRLSPDDQDALRTKLFLLIQTDQYQSALDLISSFTTDASKYEFERAYLLYRLQVEKESGELVKQLKETGSHDDNRGLLHLEAQLKYREADYEAARDLYNDLLDSCPPDTDEHPDLVTNLNATESHIDFLNSGYLSALSALETPVDALEEAGAPSLLPSTSTTAPVISKTESSAAAPAPTTANKPPRKSRLPKHVVLGVTPLPDPERWLKKKERSSVITARSQAAGRKGKKRGGEGMGTGMTQGVALPAHVSERAAAPFSTPSVAGSKKGKKK
ncbi:hypothetical protein FRC02_009572 [Tulasnella sp. 418]|nr:hypothetical protein FRC02_009572 [Tulasnella sp. 418]